MTPEKKAKLLMRLSGIMSSKPVSIIWIIILAYYACYWGSVIIWEPIKFLIDLL